jgi:hypothetical protein
MLIPREISSKIDIVKKIKKCLLDCKNTRGVPNKWFLRQNHGFKDTLREKLEEFLIDRYILANIIANHFINILFTTKVKSDDDSD